MPSDTMATPGQSPAPETSGAAAGAAGGRATAPARRPGALWRCLLLVLLFAATMKVMGLANGAGALGKYPTHIGLKELPKAVGVERDGQDQPLDEISLKELDPDDYLWRQYKRAYMYQGTIYPIPLDFLVVYGHKKQTFHSPGFCLPGGGWQIVAKSEAPVDMDGLPVPMNLFHIQREIDGQQARQVVMYCFVQGNKATPSLVAHNLNLLRARIFHRRPTGALVRVIVPVVTTDDEAVARAKEFLTGIYPELGKRLGATAASA